MTENKQTKIESLKSMMESCFTYGGLERNSWNFERYIKKYEKELGTDLFNKIYDEYSSILNDNCEVIHGVYTDSEGVTYNNLIWKNK